MTVTFSLITTRKTAIRYSRCLENFFRRFPDYTQFEHFGQRDIEDYKIIRTREGITPQTVNYEVQILRAFWEWLLTMEYAAWNPAKQTKYLKTRESERRSLSLEQQEMLYQAALVVGRSELQCLQNQLLVGLALSTGLRGETLCQLTKADVDWEQGSLLIPGEKMKTGRPLGIPLREAELELIKAIPYDRLFEKFAPTGAAISYRFNSLCRIAGVTLRGIRTARRSFATTLLRSGADIRMVKDLMGHTNIATTSRYVTPADDITVRAAIAKLPTRPNPSPGLHDLQESPPNPGT